MQGNTGTPVSLAHFLGDKAGATLMEYALLACLASVVVTIALLALFQGA